MEAPDSVAAALNIGSMMCGNLSTYHELIDLKDSTDK